MMRSLYSGVAGLKTHQTKMDVIGNNIANVNTVGFKSSTVLFREVLYQTTSSATGATATTGGTNANQVGLGSQVSSVSTSMTQSGSAQSTNNPYDLMLNSDSMFVVSRDGQNFFTKVGSFQTDSAGCLVTSDGYQVMGWGVDPENPNIIKRDNVKPLYIESAENMTSSPEQTSKSFLKGNIDLSDKALTSTDGLVTSVTIYDNLGYNYTVKYKVTQDPAQVDKSLYNVEIVSIKDKDNNDILSVDDPTTTEIEPDGGYEATFSITNPTTGAVTSTNLLRVKFNPDTGEFDYVGMNGVSEVTMKIDSTDADHAEVFKSKINGEIINGVQMDFNNLTMYSSNGESTVKVIRGSTTSLGGGRSAGEMTDVNIDGQGMIYGVYDNGETKLLGQITVANFTNPIGLEAIGNSLYKETQNSGQFDGIGAAVSDSGGKMTQGVLEMSNVDLSAEFTEMITTQRGFQANSRIITTSDSMLEELVNLKR